MRLRRPAGHDPETQTPAPLTHRRPPSSPASIPGVWATPKYLTNSGFILRIYLFRARQTVALEGRTRFGPFPAEWQVRQTPWPHAWGRGALSRQSVGEVPGSSRIHGPRLGASAAGKKGHVLNFFLFRGVFFLQYALFMLVALGLGVLVEGLVLCALQGGPSRPLWSLL